MKISETPQKLLLKIYCYNSNKVTRMVKHFQKRSNEKFTSPFNLIVLNTTKHSNSFHGQTSLRKTIFSVLISGVNLLLIGLRKAWMDRYICSILYKLIHFFLPLNPAIHRMDNASNILCPRCK